MTVVRQRAIGDCGLAALSMIASIPYEDVQRVVAGIDHQAHGTLGLNNRDVIVAAALLGLTLVPTRRFDLDAAVGILRVRWSGPTARTARGGHFVAVKDARIFCPTEARGVSWRGYLAARGGRACTLLRSVQP